MFKRKREILAKLYGNNQGGNLRQSLLDGAPFLAQLTHSLVLQRGTGSPTFTRATTATVRDNEGVLRTAIAGEARFEGARRVRNLLTYTEDFSNAAWVKTGATISANSIAAPDGTLTADKIVEDAANSGHGVYEQVTLAVGNTYIWSAYVKYSGRQWFAMIPQSAGITTAQYYDIQNGVLGIARAGITATITDVGDGWYRCTAKAVVSGGTTCFINTWSSTADGTASYQGDGASGYYIWGAQLEDITGRTDQTTPSEYVSVGVLSAPYHGSGVDGVKCFNTDLDGSLIPAATNTGYVAEGARTNLALSSDDLTNAAYWTVFETTATANQAIGSDGAMSMDQITETAVTQVHLVRTINTPTAINSTYTGSIDLKVGTQRYATLLLWGVTSATEREKFTVDLQTGTKTTAGTVPANCIIEAQANGVYRCKITGTTSGTDVNVNLYVYLSNDGTNNPSYAGDTGKYIYAGKGQIELGASASSYIATTVASVTRNADVLTYPSAGNIDGTKGWCYADINMSVVTGVQNLVLTDTIPIGSGPLYLNSANLFLIDGAQRSASPALNVTAGVQSKVASTWGGTSSGFARNGSYSDGTGFDGNLNCSTIISIGIRPVDSNGPPFCTIRNVRIGQRQLSASEMQAVTR